jgi:hypothetical protein
MEFWFQNAPDPVKFDGWIPVYDSVQIEIYGLPETWGVTTYQVISLAETECPMVTDFKMEQERGKARPIHRYSRVERFTSTLAQLIGSRGKVPLGIVEEIKDRLGKHTRDTVWEDVRAILKTIEKGCKYYNRIPTILQYLGYKISKEQQSNEIMRAIIEDFRIVSGRFDRAKKELNRVYFPSMRFVALKLLAIHGVTFPFYIPLARTPKKLVEMEDTWTLLV